MSDKLIRALVKPEAEAQFANWFRKNYPGPDTIIHKPDWHAQRIFRAAQAATLDLDKIAALVEALKALQKQALQSSVNDASNEWGQEALAATAAALAALGDREGG